MWVSGFVALRSAETIHCLCLAWSYPFSPLSAFYPENFEVRRVPFRGLRGLMHWDTNVLKRPRRWWWTTITPRPERKQVWTLYLYSLLTVIFLLNCHIIMTTGKILGIFCLVFLLQKDVFLCFSWPAKYVSHLFVIVLMSYIPSSSECLCLGCHDSQNPWFDSMFSL